MSEYLVFLPIEDMSEGTVYGPDEPLPLHCTLMQWFTLGKVAEQGPFAADLATLAADVREGYISLVSHEPALFGPKNDVPVYVLVRDRALDLLHTQLFMRIIENGGTVKNLHWAGAGFRPHVSTVEGREFKPGTHHHASCMVLVARDALKSKRVLKSFPFGDGPRG